MQIDRNGRLRDFRFNARMIRSHHKLSYQSVSEWLDNPADAAVPAPVMTMLEQLQRCATARHQQRQEHALVMDERPDYCYVLNEQKKIQRIEKRERTPAQIGRASCRERV